MTSGIRWVLVRGREVTRSCTAPDIQAARALLKPQGEEYVTSAVSHGLGLHPAVQTQKVPLCARCFREMNQWESERDTMHPECRRIYRQAYRRRMAKLRQTGL
ncbi:MAG: hypothetical protein KIS74_02890 [Burkholderiales bacterium]|nr:hypothetical protein [Burkholderiales bacterium]